MDLDGPHWSFVIKLYGEPEVADVCLSLQESIGLDVNILLFAIFAAAERKIPIRAQDVSDMDMAVDAWRSESVLPLRSIRRRLKHAAGPLPPEYAEALRAKVKRLELLAEQMEQALLARWLLTRADPSGAPAPVDMADVIRTVITYFAAKAGGPEGGRTPDVLSAASILQRAADASRRQY